MGRSYAATADIDYTVSLKVAYAITIKSDYLKIKTMFNISRSNEFDFLIDCCLSL